MLFTVFLFLCVCELRVSVQEGEEDATGEASFSFFEVVVADDADEEGAEGVGDEVGHGVLETCLL